MRATRSRLAAAALVPVLMAVVAAPGRPAGAASAVNHHSAARRWYQSVVSDLTPLRSALIDGLNAASAWQQSSESAATAGRAIRNDLPALEAAERRLERLRPLAGHSGVKTEYGDAVTLYVESFEVELATTGLPPGALVSQLQLEFVRIRELGDLTFDEGTAALASVLGAAAAGADVAAAARLPDWSALALAPGPPLVATWTGTTDEPRGTEAADAWAHALRSDGAPSATVLGRAVRGTQRPRQLAALATAYGHAEAVLSSIPAPAGQPRRSALVRIALLVDVEAVLAEEAQDLSHVRTRALANVAAALATIATELGHVASSSA